MRRVLYLVALVVSKCRSAYQGVLNKGISLSILAIIAIRQRFPNSLSVLAFATSQYASNPK